MGRGDDGPRERRSRVSFGFRPRGGPDSSPSSPGFLSRFARATAALALTALVMSGTTLGLVTPVHAASDGELRIEDGPSDNEGRLEIFHDGEWGAVCDDFFSNVDAKVSCKQLGYTGGRSLRGNWPAPRGMSIWLDDVGCTGSESRLDACPHPGWGQHNCAAREAVGVRCSSSTSSPTPPKHLRTHSTGRLTETRLRWTLPAQPAGVTVDNVEVHVISDGVPPWTTVATLPADVTSHTVIGLSPGQVYSFRIRLVTNKGNADSKRITIFRRAPPKPVFDFSASNVAKTTVHLSWTKPASFPTAPTVSGIEVQQLGADGVWSTVRTFTGRGDVQFDYRAKPMSHTVTGLSAGTAYTFRVRIVAETGNADSESVSVTTLGRDVNPAIGLTVSNPTESTLDLSWTLPAQPEGVTVTGAEVQQQSGDSWGAVATLAADATSHTVTGLTGGTSYTFRIRLATSSGNADSHPVSAIALAPPRPVAGLTVSDTTRTSVELSWTLPAQGTGVTVGGVEVQYKLGASWSTAWSTVATLAADATSHTVSGLTPGTSYAFRIRIATNNGHAESRSVRASAMPSPRPATGVTVSYVKTAGFGVSWTIPAQPEGVSVTEVVPYLVYDRGMVGPVLPADATSYEAAGLTPATTYTVLIELITNNGNAHSEPVSVTTLAVNAPPAKPATGLSASNATQTTMDLSWTLPAQGMGVSVTAVEVQQQGADDAWATVATLATDATSHSVTGLTAGTAYTFRVRLATSSGNADSESVSASTVGAPKPATAFVIGVSTPTTVFLSWGLPEQPAGVTVTGVEVQQRVGGDLEHGREPRGEHDPTRGDGTDRRRSLQLPHPAHDEQRKRGF